MMPAALRALSRVWSARARTSAATTAKPRPCSPALAASIVRVQRQHPDRRADPIDGGDDPARLGGLGVDARADAGDLGVDRAHGLPDRIHEFPAKAIGRPRRRVTPDAAERRRQGTVDACRLATDLAGEAGGLSIGAGGVAHECRHAGHSVGDAPAFGRRGRVVLKGVDGFQHVTRPSREDAGRIAHGP